MLNIYIYLNKKKYYFNLIRSEASESALQDRFTCINITKHHLYTHTHKWTNKVLTNHHLHFHRDSTSKQAETSASGLLQWRETKHNPPTIPLGWLVKQNSVVWQPNSRRKVKEYFIMEPRWLLKRTLRRTSNSWAQKTARAQCRNCRGLYCRWNTGSPLQHEWKRKSTYALQQMV